MGFGVFLYFHSNNNATPCQTILLTATLLQPVHFHNTFVVKARKLRENTNK